MKNTSNLENQKKEDKNQNQNKHLIHREKLIDEPINIMEKINLQNILAKSPTPELLTSKNDVKEEKNNPSSAISSLTTTNPTESDAYTDRQRQLTNLEKLFIPLTDKTNPHILRRNKTIKLRSICDGFNEDSSIFRPEFLLKQKFVEKNEKLWRLMDTYLSKDTISIQKAIVNHIEYTLARTRFDLDKYTLFQGVALSVRDRLLENWNDLQMTLRCIETKRVSYLSLEFLLGRLLQNALIKINMEAQYTDALNELGYKLEDIYEKENDAALGNGGLGRLAACFLDSLTSLNFPACGYGIRYDYGIFKQVIENFQQNELPDYWLTKGNPWEIMRLDVKYTVKFYGSVKTVYKNGKQVKVWESLEDVEAIAYDTVIPGWNTRMVNTLRLWKSFPSREFDFDSFNKGDYQSALEKKNNASYITSVLYPNDSTSAGKELRLKQQYFFCSATIQDIIKTFRETNKPWSEFSEANAIQLNDTHPAVAIPELLYQLFDIYCLELDEALDIVYKTFSYTNHTVLPEAIEKWNVDVLGNLLPRHLELIYLINHVFLEKVKKRYPLDNKKLSVLSIIEESHPKLIRMSNLCIISSHTVNGVAQLHTELLKNILFKEFNEYFPDKFVNITNGVTPRRWIHCSFKELSALLIEYYGSQDWLSELSLLENLPTYIKSINKIEEFIDKFAIAKTTAKNRLVAWVKANLAIEIDSSFLFDVQVKRIHEYKRQFMNCLYCIYRYMKLKEMKSEEREKVVKRVTFFGGKAAPGYTSAKNFIRLINQVASVVNNDEETNKYFKIIFIPDYKVSLAQLIIPAADISQHISTAGTEASGTSNMKFAMTGSLILGTKDGANIEIAREIGEENIFFFGTEINQVTDARNKLKNSKIDYVGTELRNVFNYILKGKFGDPHFIKDYINNITSGGDWYLICEDFFSYLEAQEKVDETYCNLFEWYKKALISISRMGYFSSDRSIQDYSELIWKLKPIEFPNPSREASKRVISRAYLKKLDSKFKEWNKKSKSYCEIKKLSEKKTNSNKENDNLLNNKDYIKDNKNANELNAQL